MSRGSVYRRQLQLLRPLVRAVSLHAEVSRLRDGKDRAIIAVERSIGAWSRLRDQEPKAVLERMVELVRIRAMADRVFPRAREFKRPGFDDRWGQT